MKFLAVCELQGRKLHLYFLRKGCEFTGRFLFMVHYGFSATVSPGGTSLLRLLPKKQGQSGATSNSKLSWEGTWPVTSASPWCPYYSRPKAYGLRRIATGHRDHRAGVLVPCALGNRINPVRP